MKICLNMIVKNEASVIERCLLSVRKFIDYWVIADTGSTDGTQQIIRRVLKDIPGELHERPWVNFAHNRNEVLSFSKQKGDYILLIDADECLEYAPSFSLPKLDKDVYGIIHRSENIEFQRGFLLNNHIPWVWVGVIHEEPKAPTQVSVGFLASIVNVCLQDGNRSQDPEKFIKDLGLLEEALRQEPHQARYVFYLAETHLILENYTEALIRYQQRSVMEPANQEVFWSLYQIGRLKEQLREPAESIIQSYCVAYQHLPSRVEPLFSLSNYYLSSKMFYLAYLIAKEAMAIPTPLDPHFVETWMYEWGVLFLFVKSAYAMGRMDEARLASKKLLSVKSFPPHYKEELKKIF
ncbi:MAG: glycosyltransferase [Chlamydiales bacterium]|nr:glycosyltransferase [Chlamydiales bacterium]